MRFLLAIFALVAFGVESPSAGPSTRPSVSQQQINQIIEIIYADQPEPIALGIQILLGSTVPGLTPVAPVPARVIGMVPSFVNHAYFVLDDGRVVIVEPTKLEIVAIFG